MCGSFSTATRIARGFFRVTCALGRSRRKRLCQLIVGNPLLEHGPKHRNVDLIALGSTRVTLGDETRELLVGGIERFNGLGVGVMRLSEGRTCFRDLGVFLGLILGLITEEHRQVAAFD